MDLQQLIRQLDSSDPSERRNAIIALGKAKNPAALKYLKAVYQTDPQPELRELAKKAGLYIRQNAQPAAEPASSARQQETPAYESPPRQQQESGPGFQSAQDYYAQQAKNQPPPYSTEPAASARDREKARALLNRAIDEQHNGKFSAAMESLVKALNTDPALRKDTVAIGVASMLTGQQGTAAIQALIDPYARQQHMQYAAAASAPRQRATSKSGNFDWWSVFFYLAIYGVVMVLGFIGLYVLAIETLNNNPAYAAVDTSGALDTTIILGLAIAGAFVAGYSAFMMVVQNVAINFSATMFLGGRGGLLDLFQRTLPFQIGVVVVLFVGYAGLLLEPSGSLAPIIGAGMFFGSFGVLFYMGYLVGEAYEFGMANGCLAMAISTVLLFMLGCMASFCLSAGLAPTGVVLPL